MREQAMIDKPLVTRYEGNPILTKHDIPYAVETVHNAGATKNNGQYILLFRSHLRNGRSIIGIARSDDGYKFQADPKPFMVPSSEIEFAMHEEYGVEDPRICTIAGEHYITYSAYSRFGVRIGLAKTHDFKTVERVSLISQADMRNVVLFPDTYPACPVSLGRNEDRSGRDADQDRAGMAQHLPRRISNHG
jgi:predicted GH43/DUF377 family glycosyl hydrolase